MKEIMIIQEAMSVFNLTKTEENQNHQKISRQGFDKLINFEIQD